MVISSKNIIISYWMRTLCNSPCRRRCIIRIIRVIRRLRLRLRFRRWNRSPWTIRNLLEYYSSRFSFYLRFRSSFRSWRYDLRNRGAQAILLACTELPVAFSSMRIGGSDLFDPTRILAQAAIREAGAGIKPEYRY